MADEDSMSRTSDPNLWNRLETYSLDQPGVSMPFSARLARETGWSSEFTQRVIQEYKRFIYLLCVSAETLTPSQDVDEVWHLHLIYTRDYWIDFCRDVLGREIHHDPTEGGAVESAKYRNCYRRTKVRYREEFNMTPPLDIWPDEQIRFKDARRSRRSSWWRSLSVTRSHLGIVGCLAILVLFAGWSFEGSFSSVAPVLAGIAAFFALTMLLPVRRPRRDRQNASGCGGGGSGGSSSGDGDCGCSGGGCGGGD
ncbi:hypothetical protein IE4872_PD01842 (plasmid) [Rhizobium gallicum]|uniref:TIGR04222 domain-containing membrane protein n=2 Tax=Rhizobium gallicum TaxID=56730 RepID=A0A1L5NWX3_9HYPH|nr:hypothetical protein IE4872_PD01842 [Rhizobium gallicum]